jgi:two-component system nitrate/nitrite sensor histidine kinase NarX
VSRRVTNAVDLQELLEIAARIPVDLLGARSTTVITFDQDSDQGDLEVTWGLDDEAVQIVRRDVESRFSASRCTDCQPLAAHVDHDCPLLESVRTSEAGQGIGQIVCLPLGRGQERSGVVTAYLDNTIALNDEEISLISIVAAEITAAMESARLRSRQMATLYAVDQATRERPDLSSLLQRVLASTMTGWGVDAGAIVLVGEENDSWRIETHRGLGPDISSPTFDRVLRLADKAQREEQAVIIQEGTGQAELASLAAILLQTEGQTLGVLFLGSSRPAMFKPAQMELLKAVGSQIALAVRNAQLYSQLRETAVLEERYRLSREMHDGVAQTLSFLGLQAERLEQLVDSPNREILRRELKETRRAIAEAYLDVREAIDGLRLTIDQPEGFTGALQTHVQDFTRRTGLSVDCSGVKPAGEVPPEVALHLLRISQEALTNIRRHANAQHVWVSLIRDNGHLELTVADDGKGFDSGSSRDRHHVGLASMRERVRGLKGQLTLVTSPGQGTRVTARVPLS